MSRPSGPPPPERQALFRAEDRLSFLYAERCTVHRDSNAVTLTDQRGVVHVPAASIAVLMLGPGTRVTHGAMSLLGDCSVSIAWVGEMGVRYYAHGRPLAKSSRMAEAQARIVSNQRSRLTCARAMYAMRFPGEDVSALSMNQLRGREGARMKRVYTAESERTGVEWNRRSYSPGDFGAGDHINRSLTAANAALYAVVHSVVASLGCVPALGVVHTGTDRAFVYDIADLYKAEVAIPAAFDSVASDAVDPAVEVRRRVRDSIVSSRLLRRIVADVHELLGITDDFEPSFGDLLLWSELEARPSGVNWAEADLTI